MKINIKRKAFTLIELLIVIAIIGILFVVLVSKVDFATDKAKATGVQTDFRSFQVAFETVSRENSGFATLGWDTGDNAGGVAKDGPVTIGGVDYTYTNADKDAGDRKRNSYDVGDLNLNGKCDADETFTGRKIYTETWTGIYTLDNPGDTTDVSAYIALEQAINRNLDPLLHVTIDPENKTFAMKNGAQDPWDTEYHGFLTNATVDKMDRGAIVMYSNGPNKVFKSEQTIANGIVAITVPGNNIQGMDDYSISTVYTYMNGYGEIKTNTFGFSNNQGGNQQPSTPSGGNNNATPTPTPTPPEESINGLKLNKPYAASSSDSSLDMYLVFKEDNDLLIFFGDESVNDKRICSMDYERELQQGTFTSSYEFINETELQIKIVNAHGDNITTAVFDKTLNTITFQDNKFFDPSVIAVQSNLTYHDLHTNKRYYSFDEKAIPSFMYTTEGKFVDFSANPIASMNGWYIKNHVIYNSNDECVCGISINGENLYYLYETPFEVMLVGSTDTDYVEPLLIPESGILSESGLYLNRPYSGFAMGLDSYFIFTEDNNLMWYLNFHGLFVPLDAIMGIDAITSNMPLQVYTTYQFTSDTNITASMNVEGMGVIMNIFFSLDKTTNTLTFVGVEGEQEENVILSLTDKDYHNVYLNTRYYSKNTNNIYNFIYTSEDKFVAFDNYAMICMNSYTIKNHIIYNNDGLFVGCVSMDGKTVYLLNTNTFVFYESATAIRPVSSKTVNSYSWTQLKNIADEKLSSEQLKEKYNIEVGQTKDNYTLVDIDNYDGFVFMYTINELKPMNNKLSGEYRGFNTGGYAQSELATYVENVYNNLSDTELKNAIKQVKINCSDGYANPDVIREYVTRMFVPSYKELGYTELLTGPNAHIYNLEGEKFDYFLEGDNQQANEIRLKVMGILYTFWLRSTNVTSISNFYEVYLNTLEESISNSTADSKRAIPVCFVIGNQSSVPEAKEIKTLNDYTWNEIKSIAQENLTAEQLKTKYGIELGQIKDNQYILVDLDGNDYDGFVFMFNRFGYSSHNAININGYTQTNNGGYANCESQTTINKGNSYISSEIKAMAKTVTIKCNNGYQNPSLISDLTCKFFLASYKEVGYTEKLSGTYGNAYDAEGDPFEYFLTTKGQQFLATKNFILRSPDCSNSKHYLGTNNTTTADGSYIQEFFVIG